MLYIVPYGGGTGCAMRGAGSVERVFEVLTVETGCVDRRVETGGSQQLLKQVLRQANTS